MPSFVEKLKRVPTAYWIAGGGAAALLVDLAIERDRSVLSSLWRGIAHHGEHAEPAQQAAPTGGHGRGHGGAPAQTQMQMLMPEMMMQPMYGLPLPGSPHHHARHRRYYPAYPAQYGAAQHHRHHPQHPQHPQPQAPWGSVLSSHLSHPALHIPFHPQPWSLSG